ncbi:hypothetical protein OV079_49615 [Nannocystis pusilla]|uniref:Uncharacterized protein n=1 Tax=Nannocystis pusilla TaxID=889268 RepID=A0A9X3EZY5_9BACT|nr:hypothetical protein [Nannocystis pusilla]MCY1013457.1 hypothetical protein [Nannocystis pusilla]
MSLAPEPPDFDRCVRQPGLAALAEMVGETSPNRPGPKRSKLAERREDIPADKLPPYWREAIPDLLRAYRRICAYTALYIYPVTSAASVDHSVAKSIQWRHVYEWYNYRLACARVNSSKGVREALDPFEIENEWFSLELVGYQIVPGEGPQGPLRASILATIEALKLNHVDFRDERAEYAEAYLGRDISFAFLRSHAPFVAQELQRQGRLVADDAQQAR